MATFALIDASITINAVDLSDHVRQVTINVEGEELEDTAMGDTFRSRLGGLKSWSLDLEFNQNFAASEVDATVWPIFGTVVAVVIKPTSSAISATNPAYSGSVLVNAYTPVSGSVGDLATTSVSWPGSGALTRGTS